MKRRAFIFLKCVHCIRMGVGTAAVMKHVEIVYTRGLNQSTPNIRKHKLSDKVFSLETSLKAEKASIVFFSHRASNASTIRAQYAFSSFLQS